MRSDDDDDGRGRIGCPTETVLYPGRRGGYAGRDDADADFPGAPVPVWGCSPMSGLLDVLSIQDRADDAACCRAIIEQALSVRTSSKVAKWDRGVHKTESHQ